MKRPILDFLRRVDERTRTRPTRCSSATSRGRPSRCSSGASSRGSARGSASRTSSSADVCSAEFPETHPFRARGRALLAASARTPSRPRSRELQLTRLLSGRTREPLAVRGRSRRAARAARATRSARTAASCGCDERAEPDRDASAPRSSGVRLFGSDEETRLRHGDRRRRRGRGAAPARRPQPVRADVRAPRRAAAALLPLHAQRAGRARGRSRAACAATCSASATRTSRCTRDNLLHVELTALDRRHAAAVRRDAAAGAPRSKSATATLDDARERLMQALAELVPFVGEHLRAARLAARRPQAVGARSEANARPPTRCERRGPHTMPVRARVPGEHRALGVCAMSGEDAAARTAALQPAGRARPRHRGPAARRGLRRARRRPRRPPRDWMRRRLWTKVEI